ncbi:MAG TPA: hypothetical protein VF718_12625 [Allosphingosinicella sp.]|jgi:hypothetical protein
MADDSVEREAKHGAGRLIVPNVYEFNRRHRDGAGQASHAQLFSQISFALYGITWDEPVVLLHTSLHPVLLAHWGEVLGYSPDFLICQPGTGYLCFDALNDPACVAQLKMSSFQRLVSWGPTRESAALERELTVAEKSADVWPLVGLLDGKAANRALLHSSAQHGSSVRVHPAAVIARGERGAAEVRDLLDAWTSVVVKPGLTWGGKGTVQINADTFDEAALRDFLEEGAGDSGARYWIVEPLIGSPDTNLSPSFDWRPGPDLAKGRARSGRMVMDGFRCTGTIYGKDALLQAAEFKGPMEAFVERTAAFLADLGYSDWFDVDFLVNGREVYVTESNVRHTGGTVPICIADHLFGSDWEDHYTVVTLDALPTSGFDPRAILEMGRALVRKCLGDAAVFVLTAYDNQISGGAMASIWVAGEGHDAVENCAFEIKAML